MEFQIRIMRIILRMVDLNPLENSCMVAFYKYTLVDTNVMKIILKYIDARKIYDSDKVRLMTKST